MVRRQPFNPFRGCIAANAAVNGEPLSNQIDFGDIELHSMSPINLSLVGSTAISYRL
jgi:hypothetical protein